jgi:activator of HSP90 ATPase
MTKISSSSSRPYYEGYTRRELVRSGTIALGAVAVIGPAIAETNTSEGIVQAKAIHQEETFDAAPAKIYDALLDSKEFTKLSGGQLAVIDRSVGGAFSLFAGVITGRIIEAVPNQRIVQAWRNNMMWPAGLYSLVRFELKQHDTGTLVVLDQAGFPLEAGEAESLASGWAEHYWVPLRKYL